MILHSGSLQRNKITISVTSKSLLMVVDLSLRTSLPLHGIPKKIISDRDPIWQREVCVPLQRLGLTQSHHAYHPQANDNWRK